MAVKEAVAAAAMITILQEAPAEVAVRVAVREAVHLTPIAAAAAAAAARDQVTAKDTIAREVRVIAKVTARVAREVRAPKAVVRVPVRAAAEATLEKDILTPVATTTILEVGTLVPAQRDPRVLKEAAVPPAMTTTHLQEMITIPVDRQEVDPPRAPRVPRAAAEAVDLPPAMTTTRVLLALAVRAAEPTPDVLKR